MKIPISEFTLVNQVPRVPIFQLTRRVVVVAFARRLAPMCPLIQRLCTSTNGFRLDEHNKVFLLTNHHQPRIDSPKVLASTGETHLGADFANSTFLTAIKQHCRKYRKKRSSMSASSAEGGVWWIIALNHVVITRVECMACVRPDQMLIVLRCAHGFLAQMEQLAWR